MMLEGWLKLKEESKCGSKNMDMDIILLDKATNTDIE